MGVVLFLLFVFVMWILSILLCINLAGTRNRDQLTWGFAGALFGFLALIVLSILPRVKTVEEIKRENLKESLEIQLLQKQLRDI